MHIEDTWTAHTRHLKRPLGMRKMVASETIRRWPHGRTILWGFLFALVRRLEKER